MTVEPIAKAAPRAGAAALSPPTKDSRSISRIWALLCALIGIFNLLKGHPVVGCLVLVHAPTWLPDFRRAAKAGGWPIRGWIVFGVTLFFAVWALFIAFAMDQTETASNATTPAAPPTASSVPAPATTAYAPRTVQPNIAAEIRSDDRKFRILTEAGKAQLDGILRDPGSAQYRDVGAYSPPASHGAVTFCGLVNAKNGFGGYGGYERFISAPDVGAWLQSSPGIRFHDVWRDVCRSDAYIDSAPF